MYIRDVLKTKSNDYSEEEKNYFSLYKQCISLPLLTSGQSTATKDSTVSVVIPFYNSGSTIGVVLEALRYQTLDKERIEVIIVDDGSDEIEAKQLLDAVRTSVMNIRLVRHNHNSGRSAARNTGAYLAHHDLLVFIDSDVVVPAHYLMSQILKHNYSDRLVLTAMTEKNVTGNLVEFWRDRKFDVMADVRGDWRYYKERPDGGFRSYVLGTSYFKNFDYTPELSYFKTELASMVITAALSVRRENFLKVGGFYEGFVGWGREDTFFGALLFALGNYIVPEMTAVYQLSRSTEEETSRKKLEWEANKKRYEDLLMRDLDETIKLNRELYERRRADGGITNIDLSAG